MLYAVVFALGVIVGAVGLVAIVCAGTPPWRPPW